MNYFNRAFCSSLGRIFFPVLFSIIGCGQTVWAESSDYPKAKVDFNDYKNLVAKVEKHRLGRLIGFNSFLRMSQEPNTIIIDARSKFRFDRIHIKGAVHLNFSDFTQDNLKELIPDVTTKVLIYCNNNFSGNQVDFASKIADPRAFAGVSPAAQFEVQEKPIMMALNISTYINLYGYGYHNVYELDELVNVNDDRIVFEGSVVR